MSGQTPRPFGWIGLVAALVIAGVNTIVPVTTGSADDCLAAPNSSAPPGSHWYYRLDRATQRKCWYVRGSGQPPRQAAESTATGQDKSLQARPAQPGPKHEVEDVSRSVSAGNTTPAPDVQLLAAWPNSATGLIVPPVGSSLENRPRADTTENSVRQSTQEENAEPSFPSAQASNTPSETNTLAPFSVKRAPLVKAAVPIAAPTAHSRDSASGDLERTVRSEASNSNAGMAVILFVVLAFGLVVIAMLSRFVTRNAAVRRGPVVDDHTEPDPYNTPEFYRLLHQDGPFDPHTYWQLRQHAEAVGHPNLH